jgi:hypothetical protein
VPVGAVVGGAVAGVAVIGALAAGFTYYILKRKHAAGHELSQQTGKPGPAAFIAGGGPMVGAGGGEGFSFGPAAGASGAGTAYGAANMSSSGGYSVSKPPPPAWYGQSSGIGRNGAGGLNNWLGLQSSSPSISQLVDCNVGITQGEPSGVTGQVQATGSTASGGGAGGFGAGAGVVGSMPAAAPAAGGRPPRAPGTSIWPVLQCCVRVLQTVRAPGNVALRRCEGPDGLGATYTYLSLRYIYGLE